MEALRSSIYGFLDNYITLRSRLIDPKEKKLFIEGLGEQQLAKELDQIVKEKGAAGFDDIAITSMEEKTELTTSEYTVSRGAFLSPLHQYLEEENNKTGHLEIIEPTTSPLRGVIILMPMTGDMGFGYRRQNLAIPLAIKGYATVSLIVSFYGKRKPDKQVEYFIRTVDKYGVHAMASFIEGAKLVSWARKSYSDSSIGIAGISFGAVQAAAATLLDDGDIFVIPLLGADDMASSFLTGVLKGVVSWSSFNTREMREAFIDFLKDHYVGRFHEEREARNEYVERLIVVRQVTAKSDKFIPRSSSDQLNETMKKVSKNVSHIIIPGGHLTSIINAKAIFVKEIIMAAEQFESLRI